MAENTPEFVASRPESQRKFYKQTACRVCGKRMLSGPNAKFCNACYSENEKIQGKGGKARKVVKSQECLFCGKLEKLHVHHIDRDRRNNTKANLVVLCFACHQKLHGRIYNPLFKRLFEVLRLERFTYEEIGQLFGTTRQNVFQILRK